MKCTIAFSPVVTLSDVIITGSSTDVMRYVNCRCPSRCHVTGIVLLEATKARECPYMILVSVIGLL